MPPKRNSKRNTALTVTFCGMMAALGVVLMLFGSVLAVLTYAAPLLASLCLIPVLHEFGKGRAALCYIASAVLSALLCPDKELAFFYVALGYYPIIRPLFLRIPSKALRFLAKLAFFAVVTGALYAFLYFVLRLDAVMKDLGEAGTVMNVVFFAGLTLCLLIYDMGLAVIDLLYIRRIRPKLKFLG